jgi:oxygen-independent coproporphyrinogen-3 oxidase
LAEQALRLHRRGEVRLAALPPLSLYVHLPWCLKKCPYCDFNSHERSGEPPFDDYVDALIADLEASLPQVWGRRVQTVFVGGGTPSLFPPQAIDRLLAAVRARLPLEPGCEVTLEANPGTFERERFRAYREAGVTRLSVGVQSFDGDMLKALGRVHDAGQAIAAAEEAAQAFETFNLDLMYALPGQTPAMLERDLAQALTLAPPHLSVYHLTLEPNTVFATRPPSGLPDDDTASEMLDVIVERTASAGLARYEVSAFARPGHRCAHNLNYWRFGDYLGIGAGAHGKLSFPDRIARQVRWRDPATYMQRAIEGRAVSNEHVVGADELPFEFMLNALRLREGFAPALFAERTGQSIAVIAEAVELAVARGLVERDTAVVRPTARGFDFLSDLQAMFLPAATPS